MLYLDIEQLMQLRGIGNPHKFLVANGFSLNIAQRILNQSDSNIKYKYLEKICLLLRCTPNDALAWKPVPNTDKAHPMYGLVHDRRTILNSLKTAPLEKLNKLSEWMAQQDAEEKK